MSRLLFEGSHFTGNVVGSRPIKRKKNLHRMIIRFMQNLARELSVGVTHCITIGDWKTKTWELLNFHGPKKRNDIFQPKCKRKNYVFVFLQDHLENCSKFPLPCPNDCGDSVLREMVIPAFHFSIGDFTDGRVKYSRTMQLQFLFLFEKKNWIYLQSSMRQQKPLDVYLLAFYFRSTPKKRREEN